MAWRLFVGLVLFVAPPGELPARDKTDVIVMKNGDRITGEIKDLKQGGLEIKPPYATTVVVVDWSEVDRVESAQLFSVTLRDGTRDTGTIRQESTTQKPTDNFEISSARERHLADQLEVVRIEQLEQGFLRSLDASIDFGFTSFKSNEQRQLNLNATVQRLTSKNLARVTLSSYLTRQTEGAPSDRHNADLLYTRFLRRSWYVGGKLGFLQSDQQQLQLRTTAGGLAGRQLIRSNTNQWSVWSGLVLNRERYFESVGTDRFQSNAEAAIASSYSLFHFDSTEWNVQVQVFPSLTQAGRYRIDFDTNLYLDLVGDLYLRFSFYNNFDSRPPAAASGNDRGMTTSLGWSF
jgi:hypothetical protein